MYKYCSVLIENAVEKRVFECIQVDIGAIVDSWLVKKKNKKKTTNNIVCHYIKYKHIYFDKKKKMAMFWK